ncbi:hypothetical protein GRI39_07625 [Altererythrobacter indicus]|uniref:17 kDa surface antigen n=1 Tax=Altericroceibacterium indicum TaxID=374177 RepID=A0A845AA73_9SPHN|nr:hypothetical protein [Altericroceibacterium indicum]MXP25911.1 hypothetical protein [Altericroceibacterium indicum]
MKPFVKTVIGTAAAGAMALSAASPAAARGYERDRDGLSAGEIIAGALIIGGIAAVAASSKNNNRYYRGDNYRYRDDYRDHRRYRGRHSARRAVEQCVYAAERTASRYTRSRADVTQIRDVDRRGDGFRVKGNLVVNDNYRGRGYRNKRDSGRFTCEFRRGRVVDVNYRGIRGL